MNLRSCIVVAAVIVTGACSKDHPADDTSSLYLAGDSIDRLIDSCKTGHIVQACHEASARKLGAEGTPLDVAGGVDLAVRACDLGDIEACRIAGLRFYDGDVGVKSDPARAAPLLVKACDSDHESGGGESCTVAGDLFRKGEVVAADPARSFRYYQRGCERHDATGCFNAHVTLHKRGDEAGALDYLKRACTLGDHASCDQVAKLTGTAAR
jgi:TPR repeat protein